MAESPRNGGTSTGASTLEAVRVRLEAFIARVQSETGVPGIAVAVSLGGRRLSASAGSVGAGAGAPLTAAHRFHVGCTTKLLLAVVALELAEGGRLDLDAAIAEYLPELARTLHGRAVRVSHLLSHTSGYRGTNIFEPESRDLTWNGLVEHLRRAPQLFEPGTVFSYEHTESVLLGRILERVTGRDPLACVRETLLAPLGVTPGQLEHGPEDPRCAGRHDFDPAAGRFVPVDRAPPLSELWRAAFSSYTMSPIDLVRVAEALLPPAGADRSADAKIVSDAARRLLPRPVVRLPPTVGGPLREALPIAFGLGAAELRGGMRGHNGLTYGQCVALRYDPDTRTAVAIGLNAMAPHLRDFVLGTVCAELTGRPAAGEPPPREPDLARLQGVYVGPGRGRVEAAFADERLKLEIGPEGADRKLVVELAADDEGRLALRSPIPQLSLGFFRAPESGEPGLMLGLNAYRRVPTPAR